MTQLTAVETDNTLSLGPTGGIRISQDSTQLPTGTDDTLGNETGIDKTTAYRASIDGRDVVLASILPLHSATQHCRNLDLCETSG